MASSVNVKSCDVVSQTVVTAAQMQRIEESLFAAGMPVPALMEKVADRVAQWIIHHYPLAGGDANSPYSQDHGVSAVGIIVGPGNNGGDALVVARELFHHGYQVRFWCPFSKAKELATQHRSYLDYLGVDSVSVDALLDTCDLIVDGGFGLGLTRPLEGAIADGIEKINASTIPVVSIDLPSGLETDTGDVLGTAIRARHTLCLGLWKLGFFQDAALPWIGEAHLIPFDIPPKTVQAVLDQAPSVTRIDSRVAAAHLPLPRSPIAHKYTVGHGLLIAGSVQYAGAALLAGKGAIASGIGMLTLVVPDSLRLMIVSQLPEALVIGADETASGAIAALPDAIDLTKFDVVACGPGLTLKAETVIQQVVDSDRPAVFDADSLNWLAQNDPVKQLRHRAAPTILTPHPGEFRRLFPSFLDEAATASEAARQAATAANCTLILKGATSAIASANGELWFNPDSTPALARGGSGDVLTGLVAGLAGQHLAENASDPMLSSAIAGVWWHAQTGRAVARDQTVLGCPPTELAHALTPTLAQLIT